jgi:hypothetical protein
LKQLRRTITTPNRFTTFIQNWRGKGFASFLLVFLIALFFSCKDDATFIGIKKDTRLKVGYVDIPLHPKVVSLSSVLTQNLVDDGVARMMVGKYSDPRFGTIRATSYFNFSPPLSTIVPSSTAVADSLVLELAVDFYQYGGPGASTQTFQIFELQDTLSASQGHYSTNTVAYGTTPIAQSYLYINPENFNNALAVNTGDSDTTNDQHIKIRIRMPNDLASRLLSDMSDASTTVNDFATFSNKYKGFAIVPLDCDKIFGFNPTITFPYKAPQSRLALYYTDNSIQGRADFSLFPSTNSTTGLPSNVVSFTSLSVDRSGTPLAGIQPGKDFTPTDGNIYVQGGTSLVAKLDLTDFYKFVDTLNNPVINSAAIVTNNLATSGVVSNVRLRVLDSLNNFRFPNKDSLLDDVIRSIPELIFRNLGFGGALYIPAGATTIDVYVDGGVAVVPVATDTYQITNLLITEFAQKAYKTRHFPGRINSIAIMPDVMELRKGVSGLVLDPSTTLRIYYSQPVVKIR